MQTSIIVYIHENHIYLQTIDATINCLHTMQKAFSVNIYWNLPKIAVDETETKKSLRTVLKVHECIHLQNSLHWLQIECTKCIPGFSHTWIGIFQSYANMIGKDDMEKVIRRDSESFIDK